MKKGLNKGFSIIEVVVSSIILSLSVFGIYKLISENNKILNNSNNYLDANILITNITSCIENIGFDTLKTSDFVTNTGSFYFENSLTGKCMTGIFDSNYTFSGVKLNNLDYYLYGKIKTVGTNSLIWNIGVFNDSVGKIEKEYILWK